MSEIVLAFVLWLFAAGKWQDYAALVKGKVQ